MSEPYIVAIGAACFDEYYTADRWVEEGDKLLVRPMGRKPGGMIPNAACVMAGYGEKVYLLDHMNSGSSSEELKQQLALCNLDISHIVTDDRLPDAKCIITLTPKERTILVVNYDRPLRHIPAKTMELLRSAAYIYTSMAEIRQYEEYVKLIDDWRSHGAKIFFDVESTTFEDSSDILFEKADILSFNEIGLAKYAQGRSTALCIRDLLERGCTAVALTLGADGCECFTKNEHIRLPALPVTPADTTGAGDTFNASFLYCLKYGLSLSDAAQFSNAAAARATTVPGPKGGVTDVKSVCAFSAQFQAPGCTSVPLRVFSRDASAASIPQSAAP